MKKFFFSSIYPVFIAFSISSCFEDEEKIEIHANKNNREPIVFHGFGAVVKACLGDAAETAAKKAVVGAADEAAAKAAREAAELEASVKGLADVPKVGKDTPSGSKSVEPTLTKAETEDILAEIDDIASDTNSSTVREIEPIKDARPEHLKGTDPSKWTEKDWDAMYDGIQGQREIDVPLTDSEKQIIRTTQMQLYNSGMTADQFFNGYTEANHTFAGANRDPQYQMTLKDENGNIARKPDGTQKKERYDRAVYNIIDDLEKNGTPLGQTDADTIESAILSRYPDATAEEVATLKKNLSFYNQAGGPQPFDGPTYRIVNIDGKIPSGDQGTIAYGDTQAGRTGSTSTSLGSDSEPGALHFMQQPGKGPYFVVENRPPPGGHKGIPINGQGELAVECFITQQCTNSQGAFDPHVDLKDGEYPNTFAPNEMLTQGSKHEVDSTIRYYKRDGYSLGEEIPADNIIRDANGTPTGISDGTSIKDLIIYVTRTPKST